MSEGRALPSTTPAALAVELGVSERRIRSMARRLGACRVIGKTMFFLAEDVAKLAALCSPENAAALAEIEKDLRQESPPIDRNKIKGYVYFIGGEGRVKIGFAKDVGRRLKDHQISCPFQLTLLASYPGTVKRERELHKRFAAHRLSGEWFRLEGELKDFLESAK